MYCLHCKYTTKLRNDKEINALFALYKGVQQSLLHQQSKRAPTLQISHRLQKTSGARYSPTDCTDVHRLGGYGIPAIPTQPPNYLPTEFAEHRNDRWRISSHRLHRFSQMFRVVCCSVGVLSGGAAVSAAPTKQYTHQHYNPPTEHAEPTEPSGR